MVATQPLFQRLQVSGILARAGKRHLVGTPVAFDFASVHLLGASPPLRAAQNNHWPTSPARLTTGSSFFLNATNLQDTLLQRAGHFLMHQLDVIAFNEMRCPAVTPE